LWPLSSNWRAVEQGRRMVIILTVELECDGN
jgi:hypothetical protein